MPYIFFLTLKSAIYIYIYITEGTSSYSCTLIYTETIHMYHKL